MKTSASNRPLQLALTRIGARARNLAAFHALALSPTPFADLMLHPERLEAVLKTLSGWKSRVIFRPKSAARSLRAKFGSPRRRAAGHQADNPLSDLKNTEFRLAAPAAESVKLAADFTDWGKSPLDLMKAADDVWFIIVPLLPGSYAYRFLVDGQWRDDPCPAQLVPNPFGSMDAVVNVT